MITRDELLKSSEYWTEIIQNKIYNDLIWYLKGNKIPNKQLGEMLGLSKGRISQILSGGNLNFRLDTVIKLCLAINKIPDFQLVDMDEFLQSDKVNIDAKPFKVTKMIDRSIFEMISFNPQKKTKSYFITGKDYTALSTDSPMTGKLTA